MKILFSLLVIAFMASSCSSVEEATAKWKTPDSPGAGLAPGEKSNYLESSIKATPSPEKKAPEKKKKKPIKK